MIGPAGPASAPTRWIEDDAPRAFELAQTRRQPLFVDLWAPWCHTCLSMHEQVLNTNAVPELGNVVLLALDTEREQNEPFLRDYPVGVWPTFYLLDSRTREVRGRWLGAASPAQLSAWIRDSTGTTVPASLAREADALAAKRSLGEAEARYRTALGSAPVDWPRRPATLVSLIATLLKQRKYMECLELVREHAAGLPPSVSAVDFASSGLSCAEHMAGDNQQVTAARQLLEGTLARDCQTAAPGASADDQADACSNLRRVRESLRDKPGAARAAEQALRVIAHASANARPEAQLIYDWERTSSLAYLGRTQEAVALLIQRERALPDSYNPPHYLARLYRDMGEWELGLAAIERALSKAYGPRRVGLMSIKADLLAGAGRAGDACAVREQQLASYRALAAGQRNPDAEVAVEQRLVECRGSSTDAAGK